MEKILKVAEVAIVLSIASYELVCVANLASNPGSEAGLIQAFLGMNYANPEDQWRSIDTAGTGKLAVVGAALFHLGIGAVLSFGSLCLLRSAPKDKVHAATTITASLAVGMAFYLFFSLFIGSWLRISPSNAIGLSTLYAALAIYFTVRYQDRR